MKNIRLFAILLLFLTSLCSYGASNYEVIKLWDSPKDQKEKRPELRVFFPSSEIQRSKTCILICPGGSYHHLGLTNEGSEVAETFNQWGVVAVVLRYRVAMKGNHHPAMIEDFQRGLQIIQEKSKEWNIENIGCIGFSAGGHLVTMGGAFHQKDFLKARGIDTKGITLRPDFVCPIYPVVSMQDDIVHFKSRENLLTKNYTENDKNNFSMEQQIPSDMPPVFLLACKDDDVVNYMNSVVLDRALKEKGINHEFHLMQKGGHGFGTIRTKSEETKDWSKMLKQWLIKNDLLKK